MGRQGDGETRGWGDKGMGRGMGRQGDGETRGWGEIINDEGVLTNTLRASLSTLYSLFPTPYSLPFKGRYLGFR